MKRTLPLTTCLISWLAVGEAPPVYAGEFRAFSPDTLEYHPDGYALTPVGDRFVMSADGQVIVGHARTDAPGTYQAYRWTPANVPGEVKWLPFPRTPVPGSWGCLSAAVSGDGSKMFLNCSFGEPLFGDEWRANVLEGETFSELARPQDYGARVHDATYDGGIVVGQIWMNGVRWSSGTYTTLPHPDAGPCDFGDDDHGDAHLVSDNGSIIAGYTGLFWYGGNDFYGPYDRLVVWRPPGLELVRLDMFGFSCGQAHQPNNLNDIAGDGSIVVGGYPVPAGDYPYQPVWWSTVTGDGTVLPLLPGQGHTEGTAYCTTYDGSLIGGSSGDRAVLWDRPSGLAPTPVEQLLLGADLSAEIAGWKFNTVYRMSWDGKQIAGHGIAPDGTRWNWWADLRPDPPANDECADARDITPDHVVGFHLHTETRSETGTTTRAVSDAPHSCASTIEPTVNIWFKYTAPVDGYLYLDLCDTDPTLLDPFIAVHTGCPGSGVNEVICSNSCPELDSCSRPCIMPPSLRLTGGQTYYIQVGGGADEVGHPITLEHRFLPINDECDDAIAIEDYPTTTPGSTARMGVDSSAICGEEAPTAPGVWYKVMGTGTPLTASTCGAANYDTKISVFCGGCGGMQCVATDDDGCGSVESSVTWCSEEGAVYHVLVHGYQSNAGQFRLRVDHTQQSCVPAIDCVPANDTCTDAFPIQQGTLLADNSGAGTSIPETSCAETTGHDVWYRYTTRCDGELWVDTCQPTVGSLVDSVVTVYDECAGTELACSDDYSDPTVDCGLRSAAIADVRVGQDVRIRVAGYGNPGYEGTFPLRVTEVPADLAVYSGPLPDAVSNEPYLADIGFHGSCGLRRMSVTGVPQGLTVNPANGVISGTPLIADQYVMSVEVCDYMLPGQCGYGEVFLRVWPSNDDCVNALAATEGHYFLSNIGSTTDGPDEPPACDFAGYTHVESDIWYRYTSSCNGTAIVDVCEVAYNAKLAIYPDGTCPSTPAAWLCNDDACELGSHLAFPVEHGADYLLRVGGYQSAQGRGHMLITCFNDCNANGQSDTEEIVAGSARDCNANLRPDTCDLPGDANANGVLDVADWPMVRGCMSEPCGEPPCIPPLWPDSCCRWYDYDEGGDIDLADVAEFQRRFGATHEPLSWRLIRVDSFADPIAAHFNPIDGSIFVGRFTGDMGLYRIDLNGSVDAVWTGDHITGVVVDPSDGDVFSANGWNHEIYRTGFGQTGRTVWVSGFHDGSTGPLGMAITPAGYVGDALRPGEALAVDRGYNGPDDVWRWSPATAEGESLLHADDGTLINAIDIAIGTHHIHLVDTGDEAGGPDPGAIYKVNADGSLTRLSTSEPLLNPVGIAVDPLTQDLFVADTEGQRVVRVDPTTGMVTEMLTGFTGLFVASVDVSPDGSRLIVTDRDAGEIHSYERVP